VAKDIAYYEVAI